MILKIAWRNIWRNRRRSMIVVVAVAIGLIALVLTDSIYNGVMIQMFENQVGSHIAHLQVHRAGFTDNKTVQQTLPDAGRVEALMQRDTLVRCYSERVLAFGIVSSASNSSGISLVGVNPGKERLVTTIHRSVVEGTYLDGVQRSILISRRMGEKLNVRVGDRIVVMATALDGQIGSDLFRVSGFYETSSAEFDRMFVYVPVQYAQQLLGLGGRVMEVAVLLRDPAEATQVRDRLRAGLGNSYEVLAYGDVIPVMKEMLDIVKQTMIVYYLIIGIATMFGIINALLMSVFERTRELGILMATGMKNRDIVAMILTEALLMSLLGTLAGMGIGLGAAFWLSQTGIHLTSVAEGLTMVGASSTIYPVISLGGVINGLTVIPLIALVSALYPASRAIRLEPVRAIHYV